MPDTRNKTCGAAERRQSSSLARSRRFTQPLSCRRAKDGDEPEWRTQAWKQRVEAEARLRLERNIRHSVASR